MDAIERTWTLQGALFKGDLGDRVTKRAQSKAHLGGKERADDALDALAEQHEKRAPKTEQVVRRTSRRMALLTMRGWRAEPWATTRLNWFPS